MSVERAIELARLDRPEQAREELLSVLREDPEDVQALVVYSRICTEMKDSAEGIKSGSEAIRLAPTYGYAYYITGYGYLTAGNTKKAIDLLEQAAALEPEDDDFASLLGAAYLESEKWKKAEEEARRAIEINPENGQALKVLSVALQMMGRKSEALEVSLQSVGVEPESSDAMTIHGLALLRQGKRQEAEEAFLEALRENPESEFAKDSLLDSLRTKFPPYRMVYAFHTWQARFPSPVRWGLWLGLWFGGRALRGLAEVNKPLAPLLLGLAGLIAFFVVSTWVSLPLANGTLLFHKLGKYALARVEKVEGALCLLSLATMILGGAAFLLTSSGVPAISAGFSFVALLVMGLGSNLSSRPLRWTLSVGVGGAIYLVGNLAAILLPVSSR